MGCETGFVSPSPGRRAERVGRGEDFFAFTGVTRAKTAKWSESWSFGSRSGVAADEKPFVMT